MKSRAWLYFSGIFSSSKMAVPVISIGNLTMGGSGKTPVVIYLAQLLLRNGYRTAVISRGYKGSAKDPVNVVSDGKEILMEAKLSGDEPRLIAETVPEIVVLTGKKRIHPCECAINAYNCNIIILDDAFQHLSVRRDIDLVLFNATSDLSNMHVFPGGYLREQFSALHRASSFIVTGCDKSNANLVAKTISLLKESYPDKNLFRNKYLPAFLIDSDGKQYPLDGQFSSAVAFCGIASPTRFKNSLIHSKINILDFITFKDHQNYDLSTFQIVEKSAKMNKCGVLITTTKDLVKLGNIETKLKIYALKIDLEFDQCFDEYILNLLNQFGESDINTMSKTTNHQIAPN